MRLVILDESKCVSEWAAKYVVKKISEFRPGPERYFVLGLPTGKRYLNVKLTCNTLVFQEVPLMACI